MFHKIIWV